MTLTGTLVPCSESVARTSDAKKVNLEPETFKFSMDIKVSCTGPANKKPKMEPVRWDPAELPSFPVLVNKKAIKKQAMLYMFLAEKKKEPEDKTEGKGKKTS